MMDIKYSLLLVGIGVFTAQAQTLRWEDCVEMAKQNNPELIAAWASVEESRYNLRASYANYMPSVSANANYSESDSDAEDETTESHSAELRAQQSLFSGFSNSAEIEQAKASLDAAEASWASQQADISLNLRQSFVGLMYAQKQVALAEVITERRKQNVDLVELRYDGGKEHQGSLLRSEAFYKESQYDVASARRQIRVARRQLATAMGESLSDRTRVDGAWSHMVMTNDVDFEYMAEQTPAYLSALAGVRAAKAGITSARSARYPQLSASGSIGRRGESWPPDEERWSVGLSASLSLFEGRRNVNDVAAAKSGKEQAEASLAATRNNVILDMETAFSDFADAFENEIVQKDFLAASEVRAEIARSQYANGLISFQDWDQIETELINAQKTALASQRDVMLAEARWKQVQGYSVFE